MSNTLYIVNTEIVKVIIKLKTNHLSLDFRESCVNLSFISTFCLGVATVLISHRAPVLPDPRCLWERTLDAQSLFGLWPTAHTEYSGHRISSMVKSSARVVMARLLRYFCFALLLFFLSYTTNEISCVQINWSVLVIYSFYYWEMCEWTKLNRTYISVLKWNCIKGVFWRHLVVK